MPSNIIKKKTWAFRRVVERGSIGWNHVPLHTLVWVTNWLIESIILFEGANHIKLVCCVGAFLLYVMYTLLIFFHKYEKRSINMSMVQYKYYMQEIKIQTAKFWTGKQIKVSGSGQSWNRGPFGDGVKVNHKILMVYNWTCR